MTFPTPSGQPPFTTLVTGGGGEQFRNDLANILKAMNAKGYTQMAAQFQSYAEGFHIRFPTYTATQALDAFLATDLGKSLGAGISGTGALLGQIPGAASKGAENAVNKLSNPLDLLGSFAVGNWFLRIGEIFLGLVLIGVGVARITGVQNAVSRVAKTVI